MLSRKYTIAIFIAAAIFFTGVVANAQALTLSGVPIPEISYPTLSNSQSSQTTFSSKTSLLNVSTSGEGEVNVETKSTGSATVTPTSTPTPQVATKSSTPSPSSRIQDMLRRLNGSFNFPSTTSPTSTPTPTKSVTPTPTKTLTPSPTRTTTPTPTATQSSNSLLDAKQQYMMNAINAYRKQNGLSAVEAEKYTCDFASTRAKEITTNFSHDGFVQRANNKTLPYPSYSLVTENIAMTSNYQNVVNMWIQSPGHAANMRKDTPYVCVAYNGNYYAYVGWRP